LKDSRTSHALQAAIAACSVVERALELGPGSAERGFAGDVVGESWVQLGDPRVVLVNKTAIMRPWSVSS
jgi:hypothetical protein